MLDSYQYWIKGNKLLIVLVLPGIEALIRCVVDGKLWLVRRL